MTCLRSLVLSDSQIKELPNEVGSLLHLRYIDLTWALYLRELPETMCNLHNLQILKLQYCGELCELPEEVGRLSNLRHLDIRHTQQLRHIPQSIGRLSHLRTLSKFIVSERCKIEELRSLNNLSRDLELKELRHVGSVEEAKRAQMHKKKNLSHLELNFRYVWYENREDEYEGGMKRMEGVLEILQPDVNLKGLAIGDYPGSKFPFWMCRELPNLVKLELHNCKNLTELPSLGDSEYLETLSISGLHSVKHITSEFYEVGVETSFPKLKRLQLSEMGVLEDLDIPFSNFEKVMPLLCSMSLCNCPKLMELPALGRLESLERHGVYGLDWVKNVGGDVLGISKSSVAFTGDVESSVSGLSSPDVVLFPSLTELSLGDFLQWEAEQTEENEITAVTTMLVGLQKLTIQDCANLKALPHYMFSHSLRKLSLSKCPQLTGTQPCLPPLLEELSLWYSVGILAKSLLPIITHSNNNDDNSYPNLKSVQILGSPHSALPQELSKFTSIEELKLWKCELLDLKPEEDLRHFPMLQKLKISECPITEERCNREAWGEPFMPSDFIQYLHGLQKYCSYRGQLT